MIDYFCSMCNRKADYRINFNVEDLQNSESMNKAGWYCWEHLMPKVDEFTQQLAQTVSENK